MCYDGERAQAKRWDEAQTGPKPQASAKHRHNCVALFSQGRNKPPSRARTMVMLMALTFSSSSHNTIMLHCGKWMCSAPDNNKTTPPHSPCHLPALFTPGLHYEVQRKSSLAI